MVCDISWAYDPLVTSFGEELERLRSQRDLTQSQVAAQVTGARSLAPLKQGVYSTWESGDALPTKEQLAELASVLDVDIAALLAKYPVAPESRSRPSPRARRKNAPDLGALADGEFLAEMQRGFHRALLRALDRDHHEASWFEAMAEAARLWGVPWRGASE